MSVLHARNVVTGTLAGYILLGVNIVLGIYLMPFTMRHLGQSDYGLWMLVASMTAYFQLFDLGYGSGIVRHITAADARGDLDEVTTVISTFMVVYVAIALGVLGLAAVLTLFVVPRFPTLDARQVVTAQYILGILAVRVAVGFPMSVFGALTTARQRFALNSSIAVVVVLIQGACTYFMLNAGYGVVPLVAVTASVNILSYAAYAIAARRTFPGARIVPRRFSRRHVREVTAFSMYLFVIGIAVQIGTHVDTLIVGAFMGTSAIAIYVVAMRLAEYQRQLCGQFGGLLFPLIVRYHEQKDGTSLRATLIDGTRIGLALASLVALGLLLFGRRVVEIWMGPGFEGAVVPLYILAGASVVMVAQGPTGTILLGTGRHRMVAAASMADIALNVGLTIALIGSFGLTGVAIGTAIPYVLLNVLLLMPTACRSVAVPVAQFARAVLVPTAAGLVPAALAGFIMRASLPPTSFPMLLLEGIVVALLFTAGFWALGLSVDERARYVVSIRDLATRRVVAPSIAAS